MAARFTYSRWDGTQVGFELDADELFEEITDDLLYHGDLNAALRRLMQQGLQGPQRRARPGHARAAGEAPPAPSGRLDARPRRRLRRHRRGAARRRRQGAPRARERHRRGRAQRRPAPRRRSPGAAAEERNFRSTCCPADLAGQVRELQEYEFTSTEARERFEELMDQLRQQLMQSYFNQMSAAMQNMSPEDMQRMKDMLAALNEMLEKRERGEDPDFEQFMEQFGDFFPENPQTLDELLELMAQRMAAMQAMLNSMTPEQRAQLQGLAEQLLEDMDLRWQMDQLGQNLQRHVPAHGLGPPLRLQGQDPLGFAEARRLMQRARRHRPAREPAARRHQPRGAGRGRHRPGPRAARRRRRPLPRAPRRAGQDARGGRSDRAARKAATS